MTRLNGNVPLRGMRILVVEDDALLLMDLESILADAGAEVVGRCRTVGDALSAVERDNAAAAVLDVKVGQESITPVVRQLARRGTPFVFYTGQLIGSDPVLAEWPDSKVVAKPAEARAIVSAVADLLQQDGV